MHGHFCLILTFAQVNFSFWNHMPLRLYILDVTKWPFLTLHSLYLLLICILMRQVFCDFWTIFEANCFKQYCENPAFLLEVLRFKVGTFKYVRAIFILNFINCCCWYRSCNFMWFCFYKPIQIINCVFYALKEKTTRKTFKTT